MIPRGWGREGKEKGSSKRKDRERWRKEMMMQLSLPLSLSLPLPLPLPLPLKLKPKATAKVRSLRAAGAVGEDKILKTLAPPLISVLIALSPTPTTLHNYNNIAVAQTTPPAAIITLSAAGGGRALFTQSCIGCHDGGGNIINPAATLSSTDLQRNGANDEDQIYQITYYGKGRMPGFGDKCKPRGQCTFGPRLQDEEIRLLAKFVKMQADLGWPNHPP